jgi:Zn-dependent peptidase ImmA (M78 family)
LKDIVAMIQQYVKMPPVQLPEFDLPADPAQISTAMIEELATETRRFWGLKDGPISNVVWLLENRGCIVARIALHSSTLDAFSEYDPSTKRLFVVLSSDKGSAARSRFDAAHELAHLVLHRHIEPGMLTRKESFNLIEEQAHCFAGALLLPRGTFGRECYANTLDSFRSMKERWRVSIASMIMRASQLKIISRDQLRNLMINMGRRKWRTREPLDDVLEPEMPRFLKRCFEILVSKGVLPAAEAPLMLGLQPADVEEMAALDRGYLRRAEADVELSSEDSLAGEDASMIIQFPYQKLAQ